MIVRDKTSFLRYYKLEERDRETHAHIASGEIIARNDVAKS